jgi:hypothetical protein
MDFLAELESMAGNVVDDLQLSDATIRIWQRLFHLTSDEAAERIKNHRSNVSRLRVSDEHWEMVRPEREAAGYDREAYEYEIEIQRQPESFGISGISLIGAPSRRVFLLKLEGPLNTPAKVQEAAGLSTLPTATKGIDADDETREARFCHIDDAARQAIMDWLPKENILGFYPTIIPVSRADKDLASISAHPTLGIDSTLPQYRATDSSTVFTPTQDRYLVW